MRIRNPKVPEGINVSPHSPLLDLLFLGCGLVLLVAAVGFCLFYVAGAAARHAPVSWETALGDAIFAEAGIDHGPEERAIEAELQALTDRLSGHIDLPEGLAVKAHYIDDSTINAFASLGGHIFIFRGLLERMPSENALAMVVAHEIGHIAHRDPAASLTGTIMVQLLTSIVLGSAPDKVGGLFTGPNALLLLSFSRDAERRADHAALLALGGLYGHVTDASRFFEVALEEAEKASLDERPEFLSSHPLSRDRIKAQAELAREQGWRDNLEITPLTSGIAALSEGQAEAK